MATAFLGYGNKYSPKSPILSQPYDFFLVTVLYIWFKTRTKNKGVDKFIYYINYVKKYLLSSRVIMLFPFLQSVKKMRLSLSGPLDIEYTRNSRHLLSNSIVSCLSFHTTIYSKYSSPGDESPFNREVTYEPIFKRLGIKPVYSFSNLDLEDTRIEIRQKVKGLAGIYMIYNLVSDDFYIGSGSTDRLYSRFSNHLIYLKGSKVLKNSVKKYGLKNFIFLILDIFPYVVNIDNNKDLLKLEDYYLKTYTPNYNILLEATSSFGYKHLEVTRIRMKKNYTQERRQLLSQLHKGKTLSQDHIESLRKAGLNRKPMTEEVKLKCVSNVHPIDILDNDLNLLCQFSNMKLASTYLQCSYKTVLRAFKLGYIFIPKEIVENINKILLSSFPLHPVNRDVSIGQASPSRSGGRLSPNKNLNSKVEGLSPLCDCRVGRLSEYKYLNVKCESNIDKKYKSGLRVNNKLSGIKKYIINNKNIINIK